MHGIRIDPPCIVFPNTYIWSTNRFALKIMNESENIHHISFRNNQTLQEEIDLLNQHDLLNPEQRSEVTKLFEYSNEVFSIDPIEFDVWPKSFKQIFITFSPPLPERYISNAYIQLDEYENRQPLQIVGNGLPPQGEFLTSQLVIGNVFLDSILEYQVILKNTGKVPVHFCYEKRDTGHLQFSFSPSEGQIPIDNEIPILVTFTASAVESFNDLFVFKIKGADKDHPSILITGKVIGPSFNISPKRIDFGGVGYGFLYSKKIEIENTSEIPFDFVLRMSHDGSFERREFQLKPEFGTIGKFQKQEIDVEFIPISVQSYSLSLLMDITRYGQALAEIPITANCICPTLRLKPESVDLNDSFIGYKYTQHLSIKNESPYPAKYEFIPQDSKSKSQALIEPDRDTGIVMPDSDAKVILSFTTQKIGAIALNCFFRVFGSDNGPMQFTFNTNSIGPLISLSTTKINFGSIPVLISKTYEFKVTNNSLIRAKFRSTIDTMTDVFTIDPVEGIIPPKSMLPINVTVLLNDILTFSGNLKLCFDYLSAMIIPLKAQGTGSPIISSIDMKSIDYGYILTQQPAIKRFTLTNKSNRPFEIRFTPSKVQTPKKQPTDFLCTIDPDHIVIDGQKSCDVTFTIFCTTILPFQMPIQCHATIGRQRVLIFASVLKGTFVKPLISFSENSLNFVCKCEPNKENEKDIQPKLSLLTKITKPLVITNNSKLTLPISIEYSEPFSIDCEELTIEPGEKREFAVTFDPSFKKDFVSEIIQKSLTFSFDDHPQKTKIDLKGQIEFPNIQLKGDVINNNKEIDFGVLMMNTEQTKSIIIFNNSELDVEYEWKLIAQEDFANKVFDIFPMYGIVEKNDSIQTHFSFFAVPDPLGDVRQYEAKAICHVTGGPDYAVSLLGSSATILYKISPFSFTFDSVCFSHTITDCLRISNSSKAAISFMVKIPKNMSFKSFSITPLTGVISPDDTCELTLSILPGLPKLYKESFFIMIGEFEDVKIDITVDACFSQITTSLDRSENDPSFLSLQEKKENSSVDNNSMFNLLTFAEEDLLDEEKEIILKQFETKQPGYVAHYVIEFGEIIVSETAKETFKIRSCAPFPITFELDLNKIKRTGFKIEPSLVKQLMPDDAVDIICSFLPNMKKSTDMGQIDYPIPVIFEDGHQILIILRVEVKLPTLNMSHTSFDFGHVIIGQTKIMTVQFQNMSKAACEFHINSPTKENEEENDETTSFLMIPDSGVLPPSSFMNIAIQFTPINEKSIKLKFPVHISYNHIIQYVSVSGVGDLMKLIFEPKTLTMPTVQPFAATPTTAEVIVKNPNSYPIEFFSLQFDQQLYQEETADPRQTESPFVTYTPKVKNQISASKFAVCIIIHGPPMSGKTTLCRQLSEYYKLPVINLKQLFEDTTEYSTKIYTTLCNNFYRQGVIIDGLDSLEDTGENEMFLQSVFKMNKNVSDEIVKNPFLSVNHQGQSIYEKVLDAILSSLDGHFVFHIAIKLPSEISVSRDEAKTQEEKEIEQKKSEQEKNELFNMSEEEYLSFDIEQRHDVDRRRSYYRQKLLDQIEKMMELNDENTTRDKKRKADASSPRTDKNNNSKKKLKANQVPNNPIQSWAMTFLYTIGVISSKVQNATERFKAIDPYEIESKEKGDNIVNSFNSLLVDGTKSIEEIFKDITSYLPSMASLKEAAFRMQIPEPQINDDTCETTRLTNKMPQFFSIVKEELQQGNSKSQNKKNYSANDDTDDLATRNLTNRWKLPANGETKLTIRCEATTVGTLTENLLFSISKCQMQPAVLKLNGFAQYPEIDRNVKVIFAKLIKKFDSNSCPAFVTSNNTFNFGYSLMKEKPQKNQIFYKTVLKLTNISEFPAECTSTFILPNVNTKANWINEPANFTIQPTNTTEITIGFNPTTVDIYKATLAVYIKDNPTPLFLDFVGDSSIPQIEASTLNVDFEKLLTNSEKSKKIELKNNGKLPIYWKLKGMQQFQPNIAFSLLEGEINPGKSIPLTMTFTSQKPIQIKKPIMIEVYDIERIKVFNTISVLISVESFDCNFDALFAKGQQESFDFGQMKVGQSKSITIQLRNRGKYPVNYKFTITNKDISKYLKISQKDGVVKNGDKTLAVTFTFTASSVVKFLNMKSILLTVVDSQTNSTTAQLSYIFNASTFYSMYTIEGGKVMNFGNVPTNTSFHKEIIITNTGPFPFDYELHSTHPVEEVIDDTASKKNLPIKSKLPKKGQNGNAIQITPYIISPSQSVVNPGQQITISIELNSTEPGKFNSSFSINITEANPSETAILVKLLSEVFVPGIQVTDNERLFPRLPLCIRFDLSKIDINAFLEDENILHFASRIVNSRSEVNIRLINPQPIPIDVDLSLKSKTKAMPFDVSEKMVHINGQEFSNIVLSFNPTSVDSYQAFFEANVRNGTNLTNKTLKFGVEGIGAIPSISLHTQLDKGKGNVYNVNMGKTLIGFDKTKSITIGNDSSLPAQVQFQITTKSVVDFSMPDLDITKPMVIESGHQFTFTVVHKPQKMRKAQYDITIACLDNPKSTLSISFIAEGFCEDVVFDELEGEDNELHFRGAVVGRPQTVNFSMKNISDSLLRFQWSASTEFVFSPRVGHLQIGQSKDITVTFSSEKPVKYLGLKGACQISKIELIEEEAQDDWDDTQKMLSFVPRNEIMAEPTPKATSKSDSNKTKKNTQHSLAIQPLNSEQNEEMEMISVPSIKPEPNYRLANQTKPKEIPIKLFAVSDIIKFNIDSTEIPFAPTMMYQTRTAEFKIVNMCQIRIEYEWLLDSFESVRTDYAIIRPCPFSIKPTTGFIEPGQQSVFQAMFQPMEVDDFTAKFRCIIPYYAQEMPVINMSALSRRPICHFNVPLSDYLSRRHPDFTDPFPDDVKVIEIFAKSAKTRISKKIELINPTSNLYEASWIVVRDNSDGALQCDNMNALISSGKHYFFSFTYSPITAKTVECLFMFEIPEHKIKVPFLLVGKITR